MVSVVRKLDASTTIRAGAGFPVIVVVLASLSQILSIAPRTIFLWSFAKQDSVLLSFIDQPLSGSYISSIFAQSLRRNLMNGVRYIREESHIEGNGIQIIATTSDRLQMEWHSSHIYYLGVCCISLQRDAGEN